MYLSPCQTGATVQAPLGLGFPKKGATSGEELPGQPLLPAPHRACSDWVLPLRENDGVPQKGVERVPVVQQWQRESRHHLFVECKAWAPHIPRLWRRVGEDYGWERPKAPAVRELWKEATEAFLEFFWRY